MEAYEIGVRGELMHVEADKDAPLLWVLRERLGLTGTKYGCGCGLCGACTVHLEGRAVRSCQVSISAVGGRSITTIEGLSKDNSHPLQRAWIAEQVPPLASRTVGKAQ